MPQARATVDLEPGDRLLIGRRLVRTVERVVPNGYVNARGETLYNVMYAEGRTAEWSEGNSGAPGTLWALAGAR